MDKREIDRLKENGAIVRLPSGDAGVRVSLRVDESLVALTRQQRTHLLEERFGDISRRLSPQGGEVLLDTLAVSGQVCEGVLPLPNYERIVADLGEQHVRVQPLLDRKIV
jgi:hypothetical protein